MLVAKLIDTTLCIGCKACEVACQEWNDQEYTLGTFNNSYQTMPDLAHNFWNIIKFNEIEKDGATSWIMSKYQCMHCADAGCIAACPAPGAILKLDNGTVDFAHDNCIGCGYCITGCPFDVPRLRPTTKKVYKCSLCSDRTAVGLEPACIKTCPTNCLTFGSRDELVRIAESRAATLQADGHANAAVYNPPGVGGTNVIYVLKDGTIPEAYGLPKDPTIPWTVQLWKGPVKWLGTLAFLGTILGTFFHYVIFGPQEIHDEAGENNNSAEPTPPPPTRPQPTQQAQAQATTNPSIARATSPSPRGSSTHSTSAPGLTTLGSPSTNNARGAQPIAPTASATVPLAVIPSFSPLGSIASGTATSGAAASPFDAAPQGANPPLPKSSLGGRS